MGVKMLIEYKKSKHHNLGKTEFLSAIIIYHLIKFQACCLKNLITLTRETIRIRLISEISEQEFSV